MKKLNKGFTLIELLIVIAILATLAIVVLLALDPVQQLARTRDSGRSSTVAQLGHGVEAWGTVRNGEYPVTPGDYAGATWITDVLLNSGEIKSVPGAIGYSITGTAACAGNVQNGFCIASDADSFVVFARAEASSNIDQCAAGNAYFVYSSARGAGGIWCGAGAPGANLSATDAGWVN